MLPGRAGVKEGSGRDPGPFHLWRFRAGALACLTALLLLNPLTGTAALGGAPTQIVGPGLHRLDFSLFKKFPITERISMEFRSEFFNLTNHPNFHSPSDRNFEDGNRFGQITSTRQPSTNPRQIQFALKLYY